MLCLNWKINGGKMRASNNLYRNHKLCAIISTITPIHLMDELTQSQEKYSPMATYTHGLIMQCHGINTHILKHKTLGLNGDNIPLNGHILNNDKLRINTH